MRGCFRVSKTIIPSLWILDCVLIKYSHHRSRKSVPDAYSDQLIAEGLMTDVERDEIKSKYYSMLNDKLSNMTLYSPPPTNLQGRWGDLVEPQARVTTWDTGVPVPLLQFVGAKSVDIPEQIQLHSHLGKTHVQVQPSFGSFPSSSWHGSS